MLIPAAFIFFISGFAALVYQVTWQRMLVIFSGADVYSATIVVAAFMAGLGCGTLAGGRIADRVTRVRSLGLFVAAEAGIALFGFASAFLLYDVLYGRLGSLAAQPAVMAVLLFVSLLWPTFLMGTSLPLLARALVRDTASAAPTIGWLYAANTLGAAVGALGATWVLMPGRGLDGTLQIAAALNIVCAMGSVPIAIVLRNRAAALPADPHDASRADEAAEPATGFSVARWMWLYALAGFIALSLEIVWFRMLGVMLKSTSVTFGTLLAQYLLWLGIGSACGSVVSRRLRRPALAFLWTQAAAGLSAGLTLMAVIRAVPELSSLAWLHDYLGTYEPIGQPFRRYVYISAAVVGPATFLMGLSFPFLQRAVQTDLTHLGRRVGDLLVANIAGSTAGAIVTGWVLLAFLGTSGTIRTLVLLAGVFGCLAVARSWNRASLVALRYAAVVAVVAGTVIAFPDGATVWSTLHGTERRSVIAAEDGTGLSLLRGRTRDMSGGVVVFVNGIGQSWLPYGGIHTELGALPALIHPDPRDAAVIGLGSGDTLFAVAGRPGLERITSIEIIRPQLQTLQQLVRFFQYPALLTLLGDRRIDHVFDDGRAYLRDTDRRFDILEADALRPNSAYAGNLYSAEYFRLLRDRLKPNGLAVTWVPTPRVERTFLSVFPHAVRSGDVIMGSSNPIEIDRGAIRRRLDDPEVQAYYANGGINIRDLMNARLGTIRTFALSDAERAQISDINTDLYPRDEFGNVSMGGAD